MKTCIALSRSSFRPREKSNPTVLPELSFEDSVDRLLGVRDAGPIDTSRMSGKVGFSEFLTKFIELVPGRKEPVTVSE